MLMLFFLDRWLKKVFITRQTFFTNPNVAFGIKLDLNLIYLATGIILIILIGWLVCFYKQKKVLAIIGSSAVCAGAIGNLIDRISYGCVIDYINFPHFSIFNLADVLIVSGAAILIYQILIIKDKGVN
jgi:signal peptidase II